MVFLQKLLTGWPVAGDFDVANAIPTGQRRAGYYIIYYVCEVANVIATGKAETGKRNHRSWVTEISVPELLSN